MRGFMVESGMMCSPTDIPKEARLAARIILLDGAGRVLFCRGVEPVTGIAFWVMPGGGLEEGETFEEAARRELLEETGLPVEIGQCVWWRRHRHVWDGRQADQYERFFVARIPFPAEVAAVKADSYVTELRWWTLEEMAAAQEVFVPRRAAELLADLLAGRSGETIDCGV
jgi:8-oxo-dGTP pyrophosphatase MutT (NUDIX family)